ncbi:hypothetical protein O7621_21835 [Solwaraspora sp. WMMD937]|uniref:hypothetical protein n=1 Tax=Solwaraspora sp. WMMD937 TaxID=3016090 RepID=UPI00249C60A0|nr:hypothetical protein [Solwaraspora sp. WMMD937]WFE20516.1 hypothetical protein O7621_21835 [Solwaraspora sp. WMMD937]
MTITEWTDAPIGIDADRWVTRANCRTVLGVAHTLVSTQRLLDVIEHIEDDPRLQIVFTVAPDVFNRGVTGYLRRTGALVLPWHQAVNHRFDLALAASYGGLRQIHAPLVVMAHGAGHGKTAPSPVPDGLPAPGAPVYGLDAQRLARDGRPIAAAVAVCHEHELAVLRRQCPEVLPTALVIGDPCYDRLVASLPLRRRYRQAIGVGDRQQLVVIGSTWGRAGLFGRIPDLISTVMHQLPADRYRVAALLHPAVWGAHGVRQVRAWLRDCEQDGLILLDPAEDWRSLVVAADHVIGDHGSVTAYAGALGRRVLLGPGPSGVAVPGSPQHLVATSAGRLDLDRPLPAQLAQTPAIDHGAVAAALTGRPMAAVTLLRRRLYELLGLPEPGRHRSAAPVPVPAIHRSPR